MKMLRIDNDGDNMSRAFTKFCLDNAIVHQTIVPYTPEQNSYYNDPQVNGAHNYLYGPTKGHVVEGYV